jgi:hypothetical protein
MHIINLVGESHQSILERLREPLPIRRLMSMSGLCLFISVTLSSKAIHPDCCWYRLKINRICYRTQVLVME